MNAKEARQKAEAANLSSVDGQYKKIIDCIRSAVSKGKYECWVYYAILPDVRAKLENDGYKVAETVYERNEDASTNIKWK